MGGDILATAALTSATGFGFPFTTFLPSHWVGVSALLFLVPTIFVTLAIVASIKFRPTAA